MALSRLSGSEIVRCWGEQIDDQGIGAGIEDGVCSRKVIMSSQSLGSWSTLAAAASMGDNDRPLSVKERLAVWNQKSEEAEKAKLASVQRPKSISSKIVMGQGSPVVAVPFRLPVSNVPSAATPATPSHTLSKDDNASTACSSASIPVSDSVSTDRGSPAEAPVEIDGSINNAGSVKNLAAGLAGLKVGSPPVGFRLPGVNSPPSIVPKSTTTSVADELSHVSCR